MEFVIQNDSINKINVKELAIDDGTDAVKGYLTAIRAL